MRFATTKWIILIFCGALAVGQQVKAQVPVEKEAHHKIVLENDWVRVLDGRVAARDTTPAHIHSANSVVIFLSATQLGIQITGQQPTVAPVAPGDIRYVAYGDRPVTHIVWDGGDTALRFLVVELKKPAAGECPVGERGGLKLHLRQKQVVVYDWVSGGMSGGVPAGGRGDRLPADACAHMVIVPATGAYAFYPPDTPVSCQAACILLQL